MNVTRRNFLSTSALGAGAALLPLDVFAAAAASVAKAGDLGDWKAVQRLFDLTPEYTHAAMFFLSSHPKPVREVVEQMRRKLDRNPVDTVEEGTFGPIDHNLIAQTCIAIGKYIGGDPYDIALTQNTTTGLAVAYHGLPLKAGDEVLVSEHDHIVHHESVRLANERSGAVMRKARLFDPHDASGATVPSIVARYREAITPKTRVLGITWVHSSSGVKLPLAEIAAMVREVNAARPEAERIVVVVDGVHGFGCEDPNIAATGVDLFAAGLHKWIFGPRGTGFVWGKPEVWARMRPIVPSFMAQELFMAWVEERAPRPPARAGWFSPGGFQAYEHYWGVPAALELHARIGPARIAERIHALNGAAKEELAKMPHVKLRTPRSAALSAGLIAFEVDGMAPDAVVRRLREKKIIASTSPYRITYARLSFGLANSEADVERAVAAVRSLRS